MEASALLIPRRTIEQSYTMLLIGSTKVGKSSFMARFAGRYANFIGRGSKGIEQRNFIIGQDHLVRIVLHDSDPCFRSMIESYYSFSVGILLLYAIDDGQSFDNLKFWLQHFHDHGRADSTVMIIGTKKDLDTNGQRIVPTSDAALFARAHGFSFMELSSREDPDVDAAIRIIACEIYAKVHNGEIHLDRVKVR